MTRTLFSTFILLTLASACSAEVTFGDGNDGGGGSGAGQTTGGTGGGDLCTTFHDEEGRTPMEARIFNGTAVPIFLSTDCGASQLGIHSLDDADTLRYTRSRSSCYPTCEDLQNDLPVECGACQALVRILLPGETFITEWDGQGYLGRTMPAACWYDDTTRRGECPQRINTEHKPYEFSVTASLDCQGFGGSGGDECECDDSGLCTGTNIGTELQASAIATLGDDGHVQLNFF